MLQLCDIEIKLDGRKNYCSWYYSYVAGLGCWCTKRRSTVLWNFMNLRNVWPRFGAQPSMTSAVAVKVFSRWLNIAMGDSTQWILDGKGRMNLKGYGGMTLRIFLKSAHNFEALRFYQTTRADILVPKTTSWYRSVNNWHQVRRKSLIMRSKSRVNYWGQRIWMLLLWDSEGVEITLRWIRSVANMAT